MSRGTTPACIKERLHRAVQIATERLEQEDAELALTTEDVEGAFEEMRRYAEGSTGRIVGFPGPDERQDGRRTARSTSSMPQVLVEPGGPA